MNEIRVNVDMDPEEQLSGDMNNSIFLAGPCPRENYEDDWRKEAIEILEKLGFTGKVINPTNPLFAKLREKYKDKALAVQTKWEYIAMKKASAIVFWVARDIKGKHPAFTTNIEFGDWYDKPGVYCGFPDWAEKNEYLKCRLDMKKIKYWDNLEELLKHVVKKLEKFPSDTFFTSDTHFSQERTLELSRRPFENVFEMDMEMISNWNKKITMNDIVYHAGDFGDISTMKNIMSDLNYKQLILVMGNYDVEIEKEINEIVSTLKHRHIDVVSRATFEHNKKKYYVIHKPDSGKTHPRYPDSIVLFGHIHGRSFAKKNGFDLATDFHRFTPLSMEQVDWFTNAISFWDHHTFCDKASV